MKAYLKKDPTRIGTVEKVYIVPEGGQKRAFVTFLHPSGTIFSSVDADISEFEIAHNTPGEMSV